VGPLDQQQAVRRLQSLIARIDVVKELVLLLAGKRSHNVLPATMDITASIRHILALFLIKL
jgi:hypothetical protein